MVMWGSTTTSLFHGYNELHFGLLCRVCADGWKKSQQFSSSIPHRQLVHRYSTGMLYGRMPLGRSPGILLTLARQKKPEALNRSFNWWFSKKKENEMPQWKPKSMQMTKTGQYWNGLLRNEVAVITLFSTSVKLNFLTLSGNARFFAVPSCVRYSQLAIG